MSGSRLHYDPSDPARRVHQRGPWSGHQRLSKISVGDGGLSAFAPVDLSSMSPDTSRESLLL